MHIEIENSGIMTAWDKAMQNSSITELQRSVEQVVKVMTEGIFKKQYAELNSLFQGGTERIEAWGNYLEIDLNEEYQKIFTYAVFWTADRISEKLYNSYLIEDKAKKKYEEVKQLRSSKYFYPMLELLAKNGELPQGVIAKRLSISTNALSNFLRRNEKYQLWKHVKYGKYNYYHLTNQGRNYLSLYQKQEIEKENNNINEVLIYFMNCFADEMEQEYPNIENILHKMNIKFGKTQAIFGNGAEKIALRKAVRKSEIGVQRRKKRKRSDYFAFESMGLTEGEKIYKENYYVIEGRGILSE